MLLTDAHDILILSRHPEKKRDGDVNYFCRESIAKQLRVHKLGSYIFPCILLGVRLLGEERLFQELVSLEKETDPHLRHLMPFQLSSISPSSYPLSLSTKNLLQLNYPILVSYHH